MLIPTWLALELLHLRLVFPLRQLDELIHMLGFQHAAESVLTKPAAMRHNLVLYPAQFKPEVSWVIHYHRIRVFRLQLATRVGFCRRR